MKKLLWKIVNFFKLVVESDSNVSSKRVCGLFGWFTALCVFIYCAICSKEAPEMVDTLLLCCMGLLGIDSVTSIWKSKK